MACMPMPTPSLDTMPEEILGQIVGPLLPLKWTWLLEDESIWNKALLGRGMGRPLYTIPGYEGYAEWEKEIREAHRKIREKVALEKSFGEDLDQADAQQGQQRKKPMLAQGLDDNTHKAGPAPLPPSAVYQHGVDPNAMDCEDAQTSDIEDYAFPITCRDLCFRIYAHERKCLSCKVGDSKLSHYYLTDSDLRNADKVGVHPAILKFMGNNWGFGPFEPAHFDKVLNVREARTRAVRTAKFFVGYDFFGFCPYTLAIRIRTKSEPLTQPALCKIEISVFIPARRVSAAIDRTTNQPVFFGPEVCYISSFMVENYNGVTLGDFQRAFEKWVNAPMPPEEAKEFEEKGAYFSSKGKRTTRLAFVPEKYPRFRRDDKLYEIGDIRPVGSRIEHGRGVVLLGDRYSHSHLS
ncbi:hypothetical protein NCC49_002995 [Naganishia albida]|nr:hypothetical protein NCC49_002995 [Naganishia albida]